MFIVPLLPGLYGSVGAACDMALLTERVRLADAGYKDVAPTEQSPYS